MTQDLLQLLKSRKLLAQINHEDELTEHLKKYGPFDEEGRRFGVYAGFDPTAKSLHVGHLVILRALRRAQDCGFTPIIVFGGATGLVGDPTGRTDMRPMHTQETIAGYIENFRQLTERYFRTDVDNKPLFLNNNDWIGPMSWMDFIREVGPHFTIARLLAADVNKNRYESGGLTFMELSYQLLQAWDFRHLNKHHNCVLQIGGDDQWSNVLAGADLIRRLDRRKAFALTLPLITDAEGRKLGKTSGNAVWLDKEFLKPYDFFQYFRNIPDTLLESAYLVYTDLSTEEVTQIISDNINVAKERLAFMMTELTHSRADAESSLAAAKALFSGMGNLEAAPKSSVSRTVIEAGIDISTLLANLQICKSKGEVRRLVQGGGLVINGEKCPSFDYKLEIKDFETDESALVVRKGKKNFHLIELAE